MTVLLKLTTAGTDSGPFYLYSNADNYKDPFVPFAIDKATLVAGYTTSLVPDTATIVRIKSVGNCSNAVDIILVNPTTTSTTTICTSYHSNIQSYICGTCTPFGSGGVLNNATPLTVGGFYYLGDPYNVTIKILDSTCSIGSPGTFILDSTKKGFCSEVSCPSTTTSTTTV